MKKMFENFKGTDEFNFDEALKKQKHAPFKPNILLEKFNNAC